MPPSLNPLPPPTGATPLADARVSALSSRLLLMGYEEPLLPDPVPLVEAMLHDLEAAVDLLETMADDHPAAAALPSAALSSQLKPPPPPPPRTKTVGMVRMEEGVSRSALGAVQKKKGGQKRVTSGENDGSGCSPAAPATPVDVSMISAPPAPADVSTSLGGSLEQMEVAPEMAPEMQSFESLVVSDEGGGGEARSGEEDVVTPPPPPPPPAPPAGKRLDHVSSWVMSGRVRPENFDDVEEDGKLDSLVRAVPPARKRANGRVASNLEERANEAAMVAAAEKEEEEAAAPGEMKGFDPMADAYFSSMNQYQNRDGEDVPPEYSEEVIDKEREICPYYRETRSCIRGMTCPMLHLYTGKNSGTRAIDKDGLKTVAYNAVAPPDPGSQILVHVTAIRSPHVFYVIMAFDNVDLSMSEAEIERKLRVLEQEEDLASLNSAMTRYYSSNRIQTRRGTLFHSGEVVAARLDAEGGWFRARVIETTSAPNADEGPSSDATFCRLFLVDYGDSCDLPAHDLRKIENRFLHLPFQALECRLACLEPVAVANPESSTEDTEKEVVRWPEEAALAFHEMSAGLTLSARILSIDDNGVLVVTLEVCDTGADVATALIEAGCARRPSPPPPPPPRSSAASAASRAMNRGHVREYVPG